MSDRLTDLAKEIEFRTVAFNLRQAKLRQKIHDSGTTDGDIQERYKQMFSEGIKDGSVRVKPHEDGTVSLFIDTVIDGAKQTNEIPFEDKGEAAFLNGLQTTLKPPEESR